MFDYNLKAYNDNIYLLVITQQHVVEIQLIDLERNRLIALMKVWLLFNTEASFLHVWGFSPP